MTEILDIQEEIRSNIIGYEYFAVLYQRIINSPSKAIVLDFKNNKNFDANLVAVLGAIFYEIETKGYSWEMKGVDNNTTNVLIRNGFYSGTPSVDVKSSDPYVTYHQFKLEESESFKHYIEEELLNKESFPKQSEGLKKEMVKNIFEIFENARHGGCPYIFTCGHHYPGNSYQRSRLDFTMVDIGRTFFENINEYMKQQGKQQIGTPHKSIEWAMEKGNTTKKETGGLGLSLLLEFLGLNKGRMQIVSDKGYWEYDGNTLRKNEDTIHIKSKFPGTIVNIEFNLDDTNSYCLASEKKAFSGIF